jgi:hypothetical protein
VPLPHAAQNPAVRRSAATRRIRVMSADDSAISSAGILSFRLERRCKN